MSQSQNFLKGEGDKWFERCDHRYFLEDGDVKRFQRKLLANWCISKKDKINKILEIGAGNGFPLALLSNMLDAECIGIEPSQKAVREWNKRRENTEGGLKTKLQVGISSQLPFEEDHFDMVIFGHCLCMFDRKDLYKSIAEADRVLRDGGFLAIGDFDPSTINSNEYAHIKGMRTYKNDYSKIFLSSGHYHLAYKHSFSEKETFFSEDDYHRESLTLLFKQEEDIYLKK